MGEKKMNWNEKSKKWVSEWDNIKVMIITREMRKKYAPVADTITRVWRPAGGRDVYYLCDVIDELESILRDVQRMATIDVDNLIERRLLAAMSKKSP